MDDHDALLDALRKKDTKQVNALGGNLLFRKNGEPNVVEIDVFRKYSRAQVNVRPGSSVGSIIFRGINFLFFSKKKE